VSRKLCNFVGAMPCACPVLGIYTTFAILPRTLAMTKCQLIVLHLSSTPKTSSLPKLLTPHVTIQIHLHTSTNRRDDVTVRQAKRIIPNWDISKLISLAAYLPHTK